MLLLEKTRKPGGFLVKQTFKINNNVGNLTGEMGLKGTKHMLEAKSTIYKYILQYFTFFHSFKPARLLKKYAFCVLYNIILN